MQQVAPWKGGRDSKLSLTKEDGAASCPLNAIVGQQAALLHWGSVASPDPIQSSAAEAASSTSGSRGLHVPSRHSSSVLPSRPLQGRPGELPLRSASSLARSRWSGGKPPSSRFVIVSSLVSPLSGRPRELPLPSLSLGGALPLPDPPPIVGPFRPSSTGCSRRLYVPPAFVGLTHRTLARPLAGRRRWLRPSSLVVPCRLSVEERSVA